MTYAVVTGTTVENVVLADAAFAAEQGWLEIAEGVTACVGGTATVTNGVVTACTVPPPPAPTPEEQAKAQAVTTLQTLSAQQPTVAAQLQADIAAVTGTGWDTLTQADRQAIVGRMLDGFGTLMEAVQAHITATGVLGS